MKRYFIFMAILQAIIIGLMIINYILICSGRECRG
jgi:hypothetical protein